MNMKTDAVEVHKHATKIKIMIKQALIENVYSMYCTVNAWS